MHKNEHRGFSLFIKFILLKVRLDSCFEFYKIEDNGSLDCYIIESENLN